MIVTVAPLVQLSLHHRRENLTDDGKPNGTFATEIGQTKKKKITGDYVRIPAEMNNEDDIGYEVTPLALCIFLYWVIGGLCHCEGQ